MDTEQVIKDAEAQIALAKLAAALRTASGCTLRRSDTPMSTGCQLVLTVPHETAGQALYDAIQTAAKHV